MREAWGGGGVGVACNGGCGYSTLGYFKQAGGSKEEPQKIGVDKIQKSQLLLEGWQRPQNQKINKRRLSEEGLVGKKRRGSRWWQKKKRGNVFARYWQSSETQPKTTVSAGKSRHAEPGENSLEEDIILNGTVIDFCKKSQKKGFFWV